MKLLYISKLPLFVELFAILILTSACAPACGPVCMDSSSACESPPPPNTCDTNGIICEPPILLADLWSKNDGSGAYDKFIAGQWATDPAAFGSSTIKNLTDILAAAKTATAAECKAAGYSDCTLPAGVTKERIQYILDLGNSLKQIKSIVDLTKNYLAPARSNGALVQQRASIDSGTIMSLYPTIAGILTSPTNKGLLDYIDKAYAAYMAAAPTTGAHPFDFTFTGGSMTIASTTLTVTGLPIDTAGISVLETLSQLLRGVMNLVDSLDAGMLMRRTPDSEISLPPLGLMHHAKSFFESWYLRKYR